MKSKDQEKTRGFSLVEVLVALALLSAVLMTVSPLTGLFGMARAGEAALSADARLAAAAELVRAAWRDELNFAGSCGAALEPEVGARTWRLDAPGEQVVAETCAAFEDEPPPLRRVRLTLGARSVTLDLVRPEAP